MDLAGGHTGTPRPSLGEHWQRRPGRPLVFFLWPSRFPTGRLVTPRSPRSAGVDGKEAQVLLQSTLVSRGWEEEGAGLPGPLLDLGAQGSGH